MKKYLAMLLVSAAVISCAPAQTDRVQPQLTPQDNFAVSLGNAILNSNLNAFITINSDADLSKIQEGRLSGMMLAVKDNIHVAGTLNTAGTAALKDFAPEADAPVIARLKAEGAYIFGKANMHELAFGITSHNVEHGAVKNPYDHTRFPGGSSGGSAAAVAARIIPAAIGTDTGGSMRIPAALSGVIGFRPSLGRYSSEGITPISHTRDVPGPMALDMATITLLDSVMADRPQVNSAVGLTSLRLGVARNQYFRNLDPQTARETELALEKLRAAGVTLVEVDIVGLAELTEKTSFPIVLYETVVELKEYLHVNNTGKTFFDLAVATNSPDVNGLFAGLAADKDGDGNPDGLIPKQVYEAAIHIHRKEMIAIYQAYFKDHNIDALVFPTTILPAGLIEGTEETVTHNGKQVPTFMTYIQNTDPGSTAGLPGISLPIGLTDGGLPVGLALDALPGDDEKLLAIAMAVEPLFGKLPPPSK